MQVTSLTDKADFRSHESKTSAVVGDKNTVVSLMCKAMHLSSTMQWISFSHT